MAVKPKLCMIPSGYKGGASSGDLYSVLPSDGVGDFDFSRSGSATRINKDGLIETVASNVPRLNYPLIDGVVSGCPSLLLEPQRLNLCSNSKVDAYPKSSSIVRTLNIGISALGINDAVKLEKGSTSAEYYNLSIASTTLSATTKYSHSIFIKRDGSDFDFRLEHNVSSNYGVSWNVDFTINSDGVVINSEAAAVGKVERYANDWYKVTAIVTTGTPTTTLSSYLLRLKASNGSGASILLQDHQLEQGSFPTSYIPSLTGSATTRSAETCNNSGDVNTFNDSEGVLMMEINTSDTSAVPVISLSNGNASNEIEFAYYGTNQFNFILRVSGGTSNVIGTVNASDFSKFSVSYTTTDFKVYLNGFLIGSNTLPSPLSGLNTLDFNFPGGGNHFYGNTKQLQYFDTALTDTDLEELTSWQSFNEMATAQQYSIQ